jgi:hypothetical protein
MSLCKAHFKEFLLVINVNPFYCYICSIYLTTIIKIKIIINNNNNYNNNINDTFSNEFHLIYLIYDKIT